MREFTSNLAPKLKDFLSYKNALGIKYETSRVYLLQLDRYNLEHGNNSSLTKEVAEGWVIQHTEKSETRDRSFLPPIREFGRYLRSIGDSIKLKFTVNNSLTVTVALQKVLSHKGI